jgi:CelD/BcsL family acetyltransferase involved in cellulose biosynthesis
VSTVETDILSSAGFAPTTPAPANVRTIRDAAALPALATGWDALARTPLQQFCWARACAAAFSPAGQLRVLSLGPAERPVALAPLIERGQAFAKLGAHLELLGVHELYEPMDLLYADAAALDALVAQLRQTGYALRLGRVPADSPTLAAVQQAYAGHGWVHLTAAEPAPYIELAAAWQEPESQFNAGRRSDFRRALRRAQELGEISYEILAPTPANLPGLLAEAFAVEGAGWKGAAGTALARDGVRQQFFQQYAAAAAAQGILRLCFLRLNGQAVAMQFAVECFDRFWLFKIGYDEQFARCSPGTLLMLQTVRYAAARGLAAYEFLGSADPWTAHWTQRQRPGVAVRAYPWRARGLASFARDAIRLAATQAQKGWRKPAKETA